MRYMSRALKTIYDCCMTCCFCNPRIDTLYGHIRNQFPFAVAVAHAAGLSLQACRRLRLRLRLSLSSSSLILSCMSSHYFSFHCAAAHGCQLAGSRSGSRSRQQAAGDAASSATAAASSRMTRARISISARIVPVCIQIS